MRDVCAIVTERGAGCDGRGNLRRICAGRKCAAYGEVVWSWRRDRGVYFAGGIPQTTVTKNGAHRGEHEVSRKAIAWGKPGCLGCTCLIRVRFSLIARGAAGAVSARLSLRPFLGEGQRIAELGRNPVARMLSAVIARLDRAIQYSRDASD